MVWGVLKLIFWLFLMPVFIGLLCNFILPRARRTFGITYILGFLVYAALFEVIAIPCMTGITYSAFKYCRLYYTVCSLILAALGIARSVYLIVKGEKSYLTLFPGESRADIRDLLNPRTDLKLFKIDYSFESKIYWGIFIVIMLVQMVMAVVMAGFDGDDAYYVVESLQAQQADVMNTINPYIGISTSLDIRHALAVITMWIAFLATRSGIHATIVSHSLIPLFVIPLVYLVYVEIARILFRKRQQLVPGFMIIVSLLMMFGNVSIYTPATFFLMRTWQGKAMVANLAFPLIFWVFMWMLEDCRDKDKPEQKIGRRAEISPWIMLTLDNMFSGMCSSLGVIFGSALCALLTLVLLYFKRKWTVLLGAFICVIPDFLYLAMYFSLFNR